MNKGSLSRPLQRRGERTQFVAVELKSEGFTRKVHAISPKGGKMETKNKMNEKIK